MVAARTSEAAGCRGPSCCAGARGNEPAGRRALCPDSGARARCIGRKMVDAAVCRLVAAARACEAAVRRGPSCCDAFRGAEPAGRRAPRCSVGGRACSVGPHLVVAAFRRLVVAERAGAAAEHPERPREVAGALAIVRHRGQERERGGCGARGARCCGGEAARGGPEAHGSGAKDGRRHGCGEEGAQSALAGLARCGILQPSGAGAVGPGVFGLAAGRLRREGESAAVLANEFSTGFAQGLHLEGRARHPQHSGAGCVANLQHGPEVSCMRAGDLVESGHGPGEQAPDVERHSHSCGYRRGRGRHRRAGRPDPHLCSGGVSPPLGGVAQQGLHVGPQRRSRGACGSRAGVGLAAPRARSRGVLESQCDNCDPRRDVGRQARGSSDHRRKRSSGRGERAEGPFASLGCAL
mmetsp:Transcript_130537/g.377616  ORF Transcript_130537/g.377616 Transcript_130537/m.377616 type:complete len:409 (-) Transcript_130537:74-1300(-)